MTDPEILFLVVRLLETKPLTVEQLWLKASAEGIERSLKTFHRALRDLEQFSLPLIKRKTSYMLADTEDYRFALASFLKVVTEAKSSWRGVIHGDIDRKPLGRVLAERARPADFLWKLLSAATESRTLNFNYAPQHADTRRRLKWVSQWFDLKVPRGTIPVTMIPHYLVFSGPHFLLLGESFIDEERQVRQYSVDGIADIRILDLASHELHIDPRELYRHSVNVWIGGQIYDVQIENVNMPNNPPLRTKVNGEDEILSYVMASLGQMRIIDPPEEIVRRAKALSLPLDSIFRSAGVSERQ